MSITVARPHYPGQLGGLDIVLLEYLFETATTKTGDGA